MRNQMLQGIIAGAKELIVALKKSWQTPETLGQVYNLQDKIYAYESLLENEVKGKRELNPNGPPRVEGVSDCKNCADPTCEDYCLD